MTDFMQDTNSASYYWNVLFYWKVQNDKIQDV